MARCEDGCVNGGCTEGCTAARTWEGCTTMLEMLPWLALLQAQCGPNGDMPYPPGSTTCPAKGDGGGGQAKGGGGGGQAKGSGGGGTASCTTPPCAASLLGDVGLTTATGTDSRTGKVFEVGENIYGPFEAGFGTQQDFILEDLGCSPGSLGHVAGGIDTYTAEQMVSHQCGITLPRIEGDSYISLLDECGGHTREYALILGVSTLTRTRHLPMVAYTMVGAPS